MTPLPSYFPTIVIMHTLPGIGFYVFRFGPFTQLRHNSLLVPHYHKEFNLGISFSCTCCGTDFWTWIKFPTRPIYPVLRKSSAIDGEETVGLTSLWFFHGIRVDVQSARATGSNDMSSSDTELTPRVFLG